MSEERRMRSTTVVAVRKGVRVAMAGDGQVTLDRTVLKHRARKVRRLYQEQVIAGFAGAAADAMALFEKFEGKLQEARGNLQRATYELAKDWRTDRMLRRLEALLVVADKEHLLIISGTGELIEPDDGIAAIGAGAPYALAAARALARHSDLPADEIARQALLITAEIDIYTNDQITLETIG